MCKRVWSLKLVASGVLASLVLFGAPASAQSAASVRAEYVAMQDSARAAKERLDRARSSVTIDPDTFFVELGVRVRYPRAGFDRVAQAAIRRAIRSSRGRLEHAFGTTGAALMDHEEWTLHLVTGGWRGRTMIQITWRAGAPETDVASLPLDVNRLSDVIVQRMAERATALHPAVARIATGAPVFNDAEQQYRVALQQLAMSPSTPARRCAQGNVAACQRVLSSDRSLWFDDEDSHRRRQQPFNAAVPGSLMAFALEIGGAAVFDSLARGGSASDDAVAVLAATVGLSGPAMIEQWQARLRVSSADRAAPSLPLAVTSVLWCGIFLVAVGQRRPR